MLNLYLYLTLQLLIIVFIYLGFAQSKKYAPVKIKVLSYIVFSCFLARAISLLILFFCQSIMYLYLLKPFVFINIIAGPLAAIICLYIFIRSDKINFSYSFIIGTALLIAYIFTMVIVPFGVQSSDKFGYYINLFNSLIVTYWYLATNTIVMIICILQIGKPLSNNVGLYLVLLAALISVGENILSLIGVEFLAHNIIGDLTWVIALNYAIAKLKK